MSIQDSMIKCVVVGDGNVGKTCLLIRYAKNEYPQEYVPTVFDGYAVSIKIGDEDCKLYLCDTAGQEEFEQLRRLAFSNADIFLVCFSIDRWASFINTKEVWIPELKKYCPGVPYILVGTKIDLRDDLIENTKRDTLAGIDTFPVLKKQGERMAEELKAVTYVECSALTKENVNDVFKEAIKAAIIGPSSENELSSNNQASFANSTNSEKMNANNDKVSDTSSADRQFTQISDSKADQVAPKQKSKPIAPPRNRGQSNLFQRSKDYYDKLKEINESFADCIVERIKENAFINLIPILRDYEKYVNELEKSKGRKSSHKTVEYNFLEKH